jgi:hypothetical protein
VASNPHPVVLSDPAEARAWRPRLLVFIAAVSMIAGAFGPWLAGKLSGDSAGVTLGGDGWILVIAAALAVAPVVLGVKRGGLGIWAILMAVLGAYVCLVHVHQAQTDGFKNGWGLYVGAAGCAALAAAGLQWLSAAGRD